MILFINKEICVSLEQLRGYFAQELNACNTLYNELISYGRNGVISKWLYDQGETDRADAIDAIVDNGDADFINQLGEILLGKNNSNKISKIQLKDCLELQRVDSVSENDKTIVVFNFKVLMTVNESYKITLKTQYDHIQQYINPSEYEGQNAISIKFILPNVYTKLLLESDGNVMYKMPINDFLVFKIHFVSFKMIRVNDSFYIGETPVTQELWTVVMGHNPSYFKFNSAQCPVEFVTVDDCRIFIKILNHITGKDFRLPTSSEWKIAANGGENEGLYEYSGSNIIDDVAWYKKEGGRSTYPVRSKKANELGIYDMSGNVWELCQIESVIGLMCEVRGGSWDSEEELCRISQCMGWSFNIRRNNTGFRLCLSV